MRKGGRRLGWALLGILVAVLSGPGFADAEERIASPAAQACAEKVGSAASELEVSLGEVLGVSSCQTYRCFSNAECTFICGDVALCCGDPWCGSMPEPGFAGYCVPM